MKCLLYVVHRYAPYPGGSEYNVQRLAEESVRQGHDVTVLTDIHKGDLNGVKVTHNRNILSERWDLIIVHGSCPTQDHVHLHSAEILKKSPIYYLLVQPPKKLSMETCIGLNNASFIGCGTSFDWQFLESHTSQTPSLNWLPKARNFRYGITKTCRGNDGFKELAGISTKKMFLCAGGFWPHKRMDELSEAFKEAAPKDTTLVLLGYDINHAHAPKSTDTVKCFDIDDPSIVYDAMWESDLYILNSESEGYGLVLLESMFNYCPWISRPIAAGYDLAQQGLGLNYDKYEDLVYLLKHNPPKNEIKQQEAFSYVANNHMISNSVGDILGVLD